MNNACLHHHSITPTELLEAIKQIVDELQLHAIQRIIRVLQLLTLHVLEWILQLTATHILQASKRWHAKKMNTPLV